MTARTGDVIAQAARAVAAHMWDRDTAEAPTWGALTPSEQDAVIENEQTAGIARALADVGLLAAHDAEVAECIAQAIEASRPPGLPNVFQDPLQVHYSAGLGDAARIARKAGKQ